MLAGAFDSVYGIGRRRTTTACAAAAGSPAATCCSRSPSSTGRPGPWTARPAAGGSPAAGRRSPRPAAARARADDAAARNSTDPGRREGAPVPERHPLGRPGGLGAGLGAVPGDARPGPGGRRSSSRSTSATSRARATVSGLPEMGAEERMQAELEILGLDASRHVVDTYAAFLDELGVTRSTRPAPPAQHVRAAGGRGQGRHPDPADPVRAPGRLPDPRRRDRPGGRDVLRGRPGSLRRHGLPLLAAGRARRAAPHRPARRLAAGDRLLGAARAVRALALGAHRRRGHRRGARRRWPSCPRASAASGSTGAVAGAAESRSTRPVVRPASRRAATTRGDQERRPAAWAGAGCWCTPAGSSSRRTPTSSRPARRPGRQERRPQAVAPQPREPGMTRRTSRSH